MLQPETLVGGRYRIAGVLAHGGMGVVYRAEDERLLRTVAVKTIGREDDDLVRRLRRETRVLARLSHPNIVRLFDAVEHEGQPYLVSELVDGVTLRSLLGQLGAERIAEIGQQIAGALAAAHRVGIVHRDLKPSNVLIDERVRLLDFGIARQVDDTTLTTSEGIVGTASYLAPEQLRGERATPASDVYALGLVLVECFSGRPAFAGDLAQTVTLRLMGLPELPDSMPPDWHPLMKELLDTDPGRRPHAGAVAERLRTLGGETGGEDLTVVGAAPAALPEPGPTGAVDGAAAALTGAAATGGAGNLPHETPQPSASPGSGPVPPDAGTGTPLWQRTLRRAAVPAAAVFGAVAGSLLVAVLLRPELPQLPAAVPDSPTTTAVVETVPTGVPPGGGAAREAPLGEQVIDDEPGEVDAGQDAGAGTPPEDAAQGNPGPGGNPSSGGNGNGRGNSGGGSGGNSGKGGGGSGQGPPTTSLPPTTIPTTVPSDPGGGGPPTTQAPGLLTPVGDLLHAVDHTVDGLTGSLHTLL